MLPSEISDLTSFIFTVALESLESTLDTKPAASRDALNEDMMTIPETNREYENLTPKDESQKDDIDGHSVEKEEDGSAENKISDSATNKGLTLKTGTGGCSNLLSHMFFMWLSFY